MRKDPIFEANPKLESYHKTSDGTPFYHESDAKNHAQSLKDKRVTEVINVNQIETLIDEVPADETAADDIDVIGAADADLHVVDNEAAGSDANSDSDNSDNLLGEQTSEGTGTENTITEAKEDGSELTLKDAEASQEAAKAGADLAAEIKAKMDARIAKGKATREANKHAKIQADLAAGSENQKTK